MSQLENISLQKEIKASLQDKVGIILVSEKEKPAYTTNIRGVFLEPREFNEAELRKGKDHDTQYPGYYDALIKGLPDILRTEVQGQLEYERQIRFVGKNLKTAIPISEFNKVKQLLEDFNIAYGFGFPKESTEWGLRKDGTFLKFKLNNTELTIAQNHGVLNNLLKSDSSAVSNPEMQEWFGRLMGYPETAIRAYINRDLLPWEEQKKLPYQFYHFFRLSNNNWKDELGLTEHWSEVVKKASPMIYEKVETYERTRESFFSTKK